MKVKIYSKGGDWFGELECIPHIGDFIYVNGKCQKVNQRIFYINADKEAPDISINAWPEPCDDK